MHDNEIAALVRGSGSGSREPAHFGLLGARSRAAGRIEEARRIISQLEAMANKQPVSAFHFG
jgi:hypothetical protein